MKNQNEKMDKFFGLVTELNELKNEFNGTIKLVFQPGLASMLSNQKVLLLDM